MFPASSFIIENSAAATSSCLSEMTCLLHHGDRARRHGNYRSHSVSVLCAKLDDLLQNINRCWIQSVGRSGGDNTYKTEGRQLHISLNV